jgi:hypothetical protein
MTRVSNVSKFKCYSAYRRHWCCCLHRTETSVRPRFMGTIGQDAGYYAPPRHEMQWELKYQLPIYVSEYDIVPTTLKHRHQLNMDNER